MGRIQRLLSKPPRVWGLAMKALLLSGSYRWKILHRPFAELAKTIGTEKLETEEKPQDEKIIREVQYATVGVCNHTPWESKCLVQALTAKKLLNEKGIPCTLYMGVGKDSDGKMIAHAWLRCGVIFVTGGAGHRYYAVTGIFGDAE